MSHPIAAHATAARGMSKTTTAPNLLSATVSRSGSSGTRSCTTGAGPEGFVRTANACLQTANRSMPTFWNNARTSAIVLFGGRLKRFACSMAETKHRRLLGKEVENDGCYWGETAGALAYGWPGGTITVSVSVTTTVSVKTTVSG